MQPHYVLKVLGKQTLEIKHKLICILCQNIFKTHAMKIQSIQLATLPAVFVCAFLTQKITTGSVAYVSSVSICCGRWLANLLNAVVPASINQICEEHRR